MQSAILLVGPTSSGKTPLGDLIEEQGIRGKAFRHFDFGARFRAAAALSSPPPPLTDSDIEIIRQSMATGALLTEEQFHIARKLLESFLAGVAPGDTVVLNGMPRHEGQARGIADLIDVTCVVELCCGKETIMERISRDTGGDRAERVDDLPDLVARKLEIYEAQTRPLVDYYKEKGVPVLTTDVTLISTAPDAKQVIEQGLSRLENK